MTNYGGIDYGLGQSNVNLETGIRNGVISMNSINRDYTAEFEHEYPGPICPSCGNGIKASDDDTVFDGYNGGEQDAEPEWFDGKDFTCIDCEKCYWSDQVYGEESTGWHYESDGYKLCDCLDNDIFVLESPYYTFAQYCSPCVPGAGNLDNPVEAGIGAKCYALGPEWFDDGKAPYTVYRVSDGIEVASVTR
jgi:hypothetical protein